LIDRAIRYIDMLLGSKDIIITYDKICHILFEMLEKTPSDQSIVMATLAEIERRHKKI
jgi:hypothetical protein